MTTPAVRRSCSEVRFSGFLKSGISIGLSYWFLVFGILGFSGISGISGFWIPVFWNSVYSVFSIPVSPIFRFFFQVFAFPPLWWNFFCSFSMFDRGQNQASRRGIVRISREFGGCGREISRPRIPGVICQVLFVTILQHGRNKKNGPEKLGMYHIFS